MRTIIAKEPDKRIQSIFKTQSGLKFSFVPIFKYQKLPVQIALQLRNNFSNIPLVIGLGAKNSTLEKSGNFVIKYDFKYININTSINYIYNNYIQYAVGINFLYNEWCIGYSLSTQKSSTLGIPQIISLRYNF